MGREAALVGAMKATSPLLTRHTSMFRVPLTGVAIATACFAIAAVLIFI